MSTSCKNISPVASTSFLLLYTVLNRAASYRISLRRMVLLYRIVSHRTAISYRIVSCLMTISYRIVSRPMAILCTNSIAPIGNIVSRNIVDIHNYLLSKHIFYLFPSASIRHVNGIDFIFLSNLYFGIQRWIILLLSSLRSQYIFFHSQYLCLRSHYLFLRL